MAATLPELERAYPLIKWREPIALALTTNPDEKHYACRVCIATKGITGGDIPGLPSDPEQIRRHLREEHGALIP